jgi:hypothetical protein
LFNKCDSFLNSHIVLTTSVPPSTRLPPLDRERRNLKFDCPINFERIQAVRWIFRKLENVAPGKLLEETGWHWSGLNSMLNTIEVVQAAVLLV